MDVTLFYEKLWPLMDWYLAGARPLPWRVLWKKNRDPYVVWVSEIMLQQTTIKAVEPVYLRFMERYPTLLDLAQAGESDLREAVRGLGYYRRFKLMHACAKNLAAGAVSSRGTIPWPKCAADLKSLPGIGPYTASAIASIAMGEHIAVLDGNVERVLCRLLGLKVDPKEPVYKKELGNLSQKLLDIGYAKPSDRLQQPYPGDHNQAMMELGQLICTPLSPKCHQCPLQASCQGFARKIQNHIPLVSKKRESVAIHMNLTILGKESPRGLEIALFERLTSAKFLKGTRGFLCDWVLHKESGELIPPRFPLKSQKSPKSLQSKKSQISLIGGIRHAITHHKISAKVLCHINQDTVPESPTSWQRDSNLDNIQWIRFDMVERALVSNLDRKAWRIFEKTLASARMNEL